MIFRIQVMRVLKFCFCSLPFFVLTLVMFFLAKDKSASVTTILKLTGFLLFECGIFFVIYGIVNTLFEPVQQFCFKTKDYKRAMTEMERFYVSDKPVNGFRINMIYFLRIYDNNKKLLFMESDKILWVYQNNANDNSIKICTTRGAVTIIELENPYQVVDTLHYISNSLPYIFMGYNTDRISLFQNNRKEMENQMRQKKLQMAKSNT